MVHQNTEYQGEAILKFFFQKIKLQKYFEILLEIISLYCEKV